MGEGHLTTAETVGSSNRAHKTVLCDEAFGAEVVIKLVQIPQNTMLLR